MYFIFLAVLYCLFYTALPECQRKISKRHIPPTQIPAKNANAYVIYLCRNKRLLYVIKISYSQHQLISLSRNRCFDSDVICYSHRLRSHLQIKFFTKYFASSGFSTLVNRSSKIYSQVPGWVLQLVFSNLLLQVAGKKTLTVVCAYIPNRVSGLLEVSGWGLASP